MRRLNRRAAERLAEVDGGAGPRACTDVTGYGLFGHGWEVAERGGVAMRLWSGDLPLHQGALAAAEAGVRTGGDARNRASLQSRVTLGDAVSAEHEALCYDPQTSGGLLAAVPAGDAVRLADEGWAVIGEVADGPPSVTLS